MRKVYWRPRAVSRQALVLIAVVSIVGLALVENMRTPGRRPYFEEKMAAADLARRCFEAIKIARLQRGATIDWETDPAETGLIGASMTEVTSVSGVLPAKQTAANPNFAAVIVDMLRRADVKDGDVVAVGTSGSFPAMNVAVYAACETLKLQPVCINSAAASQWGANLPNLMWVDMEKVMHDAGLISFRSVAASLGGLEDQGLGMSEEGRGLVMAAIQRNDLRPLETGTFEEAIEARMKLYRARAGGSPIKAYINIGGGSVSVGKSIGKRLFHPGINRRLPSGAQEVDGVMPRFVRDDVPVIHIIEIRQLAERYGLPIAPVTMPEVGDADVFIGEVYNTWMVVAVLVVILASLYAFIRSDVGFRLLRSSRNKDIGHPEPMM